MKARSLTCACLFTVSTLMLAAPAMAIKPAGPNAQVAITPAVQKAVQDSHRDPANVKRDAYRHPAQTLSFFGVAPGKTVIEITPGSGWYSEILAPLLRGKGSYVAAVVDPMAVPEGRGRDYQQRSREGLEKKFAGNAAVYDKATLVAYNPTAPVFGAASSADVVLTFRNVHNWRSANQAEGMFKGFYSVLKPGGVLGVVEHRAKADVPADDKTGYVGQKQVIAMAEAAGFKLAGSSEINANPRDTKDYPNGVWTLPPTNQHDAADEAKYQAIGESDRMTLRFIKPKG
jgi:predicted methyltransferase